MPSPPPRFPEFEDSHQILDPHLDARRKLDEEIGELETRLISLKLARNALSPINRLHPDLLEEIFYRVHISSDHKGKTSLLLTWISHHWREIAHQMSSLWSVIDLERVEWVEAALSLAKHRDLEFNLDFSPRKGEDLRPLLSTCLKNLFRTRELAITSDSRYVPAFREPTPEWMVPAPVLESVHFYMLHLPPNVFLRNCPSLRSLHLSACTLDWHTLPVIPGLKELTILDPASPTTVEHLINILRVIGPNLEQLSLRNVLIHHLPISPRSSQPFRLKKLQLLRLVDHSTELIGSFLNQVLLPPGGGLTIDITVGFLKNDSGLIEALISARNIDQWPVDLLEIELDTPSVTICLTENWLGVDGYAEKSNRTNVRLRILHVDEPSALRPVFGLSPMHPINTVVFAGGSPSAYVQDATFFSYIGDFKLSTVQKQKLYIGHQFLPTFLSETDAQIRKLCIKLEEAGPIDGHTEVKIVQSTLSFHNLEFLEIFGNGGVEDHAFTAEDASRLRRWLTWRKRGSIALEELVLAGLDSPPGALFDEVVDTFRVTAATTKGQQTT
ncbi:hypothetical protein BDN72DRAFT_959342 [Pluteus cervinus]|uniref:Uncharacterized protein n=1 Tax=Pluteus cervinus TaxID=181527 RepID=A0ACD3AVI3_9AGAR|nr:hypothetical protein BDN72DRAFT_959342 [Pluteus cervinus]